MHLKDGEYLLKKNKLKITDNKKIDEQDLSLYIRQKPNSSYIFGTWKASLQWKNIWYNSKKDKPRPAVILDTNMVERSKKQLLIYLQNLGYYDSKVTSEIKYTHLFGIKSFPTKKAIVKYSVQTGAAFFIDSLGNAIDDSTFLSLFTQSKSSTALKKGDNLMLDKMQLERARLARMYQNKGYYDFTEKYVHFDVDTNLGAKKSALITSIKQPVNETGKHLRYYIRNVYVQTDFDAFDAQNKTSDTIKYRDNIYFLSKGISKFQPTPIFRSLFIKPGEEYSIDNYNLSYKQLMSLGMFSIINIDYQKIQNNDSSSVRRDMDVYVHLTPAKKFAISTEATATFREGFGANGLISLSNKNFFGLSEIVDLRLSGGFENLQSSTSDGTIIGGNFGPRLSILFPSLLFLPKINAKIAKKAFPKTTFATSYNYQRRDDFTRYLSNLSFRYDFNEGDYKKHELSLWDISLSYLLKSSAILTNLTGLSPSEKFRFEDNISTGIKYRFTYNNQLKPGLKHSSYLIVRANLIGASSVITKAFNIENRDANNAISLFGIRYANFFKLDLDYRYYRKTSTNSKLVYRFFAGAGIPLDKYSVIPFEQLYFSGGANSIRGWQQRTLGPGAYLNADNFYDRLGELKLEGSVEFRFPIVKVFKGAFFVDAGNIWNLTNENAKAVFTTNTFYQQIAVSPGFGLRIDFDFFLFRIDLAVPIKQPYSSGVASGNEAKANWNFGIGYPF